MCIFSAKAVDINIKKGLIVMKKFLGVMVAVVLCLCSIVPAMAADTGSVKDLLGGVDLGGLSDSDAGQILDKLDLDSIKDLVAGAGSDSSTGDSSAAGGIGDVLSGLSGMIDPSAFSAISDAFSGVLGGSDGGSGFDISSLMDTISGAFAGSGFDLSSLTSGFDMGSFDFSSILSGLGGLTGGSSGDSDSTTAGSGAMSAMSGIMDSLMSGLSSLGIDTSAIEGLLDNDIVNFFANMYIGLGQIGDKDEDPTTTTASSTTKPAAATTKTPKTGDTSTVFVALGTLSVAAAAAFVCLKKKKD